MVKLDIENWYRLEGYIVPPNEYKYNIPITNLSGYDIWYTNVEVQLQNPLTGNFVRGVKYKTRKFSDFGYTKIEDINSNFVATLTTIQNEMKLNEGSLTYLEPFTVTESTVICFDDALNPTLNHCIVILKDDYLNPNITAITAVYDGPAVEVSDNFDLDKLTVTGYYSDGHSSRFMEGTYTIKRIDDTDTTEVNQVGSNVFIATVTYGDNRWTSSFSVTGVKKLISITASYDGHPIPLNKKPDRKNIIVTANYLGGSSSTVTDWTFKNGDTVTVNNGGILTIYYKGFEYDLGIPNYQTFPSQIKAFYNGPNVEIGHNISLDYLTVKIYYQDFDNIKSYWETLSPDTYTVENTYIKYEKTNIIKVRYQNANGDILTTNFIVNGFKPEKKILYITAEYSGPPIITGKTYNPSKVSCKAYWNNEDVTLINDFTVSSTLINNIGNNEITLSYKNYQCTFIVIGVAPESTTGTTYSPTKINLSYPEATILNHRRRGPMESQKFDEYNTFLYENISTLYNVFNTLESNYKSICNNNKSLHNVGNNALNTCVIMNERIKDINERR